MVALLFLLKLFAKIVLLLPQCEKIRSSRLDVFYKKGALKNFTKFTGKRLCQRPAALLKKRLWRRCFPVGFVKFLRKYFTEHFQWLLHENNTEI